MSQAQDQWTAVDQFISRQFLPHDPVLEQTLADSLAAGLPEISVTPCQGKFLGLFAKAMAAKKILEIGTLGGYSTIWLARALPPGGRLITLEAAPKHAEVAAKNIARAGLDKVVELRLGRAIETLPQLAAENRGPFDLVFIDADKPSTPDYFDWAIKLSRPGTIIVVDNVVRKGEVIDPDSPDLNVQGVRRFYERAAADPRVDCTAIQTVGSKGYDGFAVAIVR